MNREELKSIFDALRNDPQHHLGLGDIRLTIAQQDAILDLFPFKEHPLPPAEGAEEILNKAKAGGVPLTWLITPGYPAWNAILEAMQEFATLHAQRIADKMVEERMEQYKAQFKDRPNPLEVNPYDAGTPREYCKCDN